MIPTQNGGLSVKGRWAKGYAEVMRVPVFPLGDNTKLPRPKSHGHLDATVDLEQITAWWTKYPNANVAARCVVFFVYDVDPRHGGDESHRGLIAEHGAFPDTLQQTTARQGQQYFFLPPDQVEINSIIGLFPGIDIKGANGYVVLPPSETAHGKYCWDGEKAKPQDQPILPAPQWLLDAIAAHEAKRTVNATETGVDGDDTAELARILAAAMPDEGHRHTVFLALAGFLARRRCPFEDARALARAMYTLLWKRTAQLAEADKEVATTYARFTQGDKVTGYFTLKESGFSKAALRALSDWAQIHHDEEITNAAAEATPEQHLALINDERMLSQRGIEFTYGIERIGEGIQADVWIGGEQGILKWPSVADLLKLDKTREAVATCLGINLIPSRESQSDWQHVAHAILQLARGERLSKVDGLKVEVQNLAAIALRQSYEKAVEKDNLWSVWETVKLYTPVDSVLDSHGHVTMVDFPQCVYVYEGALHAYAPCLHAVQRLRRIQGHLTMDEITKGLHSAGFIHRRVQTWVGDKPKRCWMWIAPLTALAPYWEPDYTNEAVDELETLVL